MTDMGTSILVSQGFSEAELASNIFAHIVWFIVVIGIIAAIWFCLKDD